MEFGSLKVAIQNFEPTFLVRISNLETVSVVIKFELVCPIDAPH